MPGKTGFSQAAGRCLAGGHTEGRREDPLALWQMLHALGLGEACQCWPAPRCHLPPLILSAEPGRAGPAPVRGRSRGGPGKVPAGPGAVRRGPGAVPGGSGEVPGGPRAVRGGGRGSRA